MAGVDTRYAPLAGMVVERFVRQLGGRLHSAFVKGSVARGDAVWGVSDMDLVLAFGSPTPGDTACKREVETLARAMTGGDALVIQRIWHDRLAQMDAGTRAWWLHSSRHDIALLHGAPPSAFLPAPPPRDELALRMALIIRRDAETLASADRLDRQGARQFSKLTLLALGLPAIFTGAAEHVPPLAVPSLPLPERVRRDLPPVLAAYRDAPALDDPRTLQQGWSTAWEWVSKRLSIRG